MSRECFFLGKKTRAGRSIARRGKPKYLGGVGIKTTGVTKRKFKPNVQRPSGSSNPTSKRCGRWSMAGSAG